jgi:DNA-binding MarR family transcriptional regulator
MESAPKLSIAELLFEISLWYKRALTRAAADEDISPPQAALLWELEPGKPIAMSVLAEALACDAANVTGLVNNLEARNLVVRIVSTDDRRVKLLTTTRAGARVRSRIVAKLLTPPPWLIGLSPKDQNMLLDILQRAKAAVDGQRLDFIA